MFKWGACGGGLPAAVRRLLSGEMLRLWKGWQRSGKRREKIVDRASTVIPHISEDVGLFAEDDGKVHAKCDLEGKTGHSMFASGMYKGGTPQRWTQLRDDAKVPRTTKGE